MASKMAAQISTLKEKGISADKIAEYRAAFELFDDDQSGKITAEKIGRLLSKFDQSFGQADLEYMLKQFDEKMDVDFVKFALTLDGKMKDPKYNEAFGDAFDLFDITRSGELSRGDIIAGMTKLGESLTEAEAEEMLKIAKKKDDFVRTMSNAVMATGAGGGGGGGAAAGGAAAAAGDRKSVV